MSELEATLDAYLAIVKARILATAVRAGRQRREYHAVVVVEAGRVTAASHIGTKEYPLLDEDLTEGVSSAATAPRHSRQGSG